jgi:Zn-dependent alcohol dehydrogenase
MAFHDHGGLGDDQTSAGTLRVVFGHERRGIVISIGTATREWGHENAVWQI